MSKNGRDDKKKTLWAGQKGRNVLCEPVAQSAWLNRIIAADTAADSRMKSKHLFNCQWCAAGMSHLVGQTEWRANRICKGFFGSLF